MSKLNELIRELCPDGVEYVELGKIAEIGTGRSDRKDAKDDGMYPFYVRSKEVLRNDKYEFDEAAIIIPGEGNVGEVFHYVNGKYALHQRAYRIHIIKNGVEPKFIYYFMVANFKKFIVGKAVMATVTSLRKPMLLAFKIPLPPLEVQKEIVKTLDAFTKYDTELQAELQARIKQYEYYRDKLLTFDEVGGAVRKVKLGEIVKIKNGKDYKHLGQGNIPVYGSGGIMTHVDVAVYNKPSVLIPRKGSLANLYFVETPFWNVDTIFYTEINESNVVPKYLFYVLQRKHLEKLDKAGGVPSLTQTILNDVEINLPPLETQNRIVHVLDNFDTICSDLKIGLPAEIEKRQQQYEFYRDAILTFVEKGEMVSAERERESLEV